ncbi:MAG: ADP-forming succinate--CoA ligase subunit beta [Caldilineae bacterium]|nr:MAG: ADP-forming succinate--CoA ligase subunit beta [Caldilineae bacterium]
MNIHEYQAKRLFARYDIPIPGGDVATTPQEARQIAEKLGVPVVVKAQVLVGGRGKAGGIKLARNPDEAAARAEEILGMDIKGLTVEKVLVDEAADIQDELYLGVVLDRGNKRVILMGSSEGGVDIEEVAATSPEKIVRVTVEPLLGLREFQARQLAYGMGLDKGLVRQFVGIAQGLYRAFMENDASLAEINPLVVTGDGRLLAVDGKMNIDDSGLFRHPEIEAMRDTAEEDESERLAREAGLSYVDLDGEIGCMVNGAGLAMATMDIVKLYGGAPANFLDIGGGAKADKVAAALRIILSDPRVKAVLFNIFGGITRGDEVARGILEALSEIQTDVPMVVRLVGTRAEEGRQLLADAKMITAESLSDAAQKAVAAARGQLA